MLDEHGADDLAAHERWHARGLLGAHSAYVAAQQPLIAGGALIGARQPNRQAGVGRGTLEALRGRVAGVDWCDCLQSVGGVVAVEHRHAQGVGDPFDVARQQVVGLRLGACDLHSVDELGLSAAAPAGAARRALDEQQVQEAEEQKEPDHEHDRPAGGAAARFLALAGEHSRSSSFATRKRSSSASRRDSSR